MSNNNNNVRWVKNGNEYTKDDFKFEIFRRKNDTNSWIRNDLKSAVDSPSKCPINETMKSEPGDQQKWQHITVKNSMEHDKLYSNPFKNNSTNESMIDSTEVVENSCNFNHPIVTGFDTSNNNRPNFKNNLFISDSWREKNDVNKIKDAWLSYVNSPSHITLPFINLQTIANPYVQIPMQICQMVSNVNPKMGEVLCRKRTETAMILWIASKSNQ